MGGGATHLFFCASSQEGQGVIYGLDSLTWTEVGAEVGAEVEAEENRIYSISLPSNNYMYNRELKRKKTFLFDNNSFGFLSLFDLCCVLLDE